MPLPVPDLSLSQGQMAWALCYGQEPDQRLRDQLRYLRQLGIPKTASERGAGSGNRIRYDFYDLVETGLGVTGLMLGSKPRDLFDILVGTRSALRAFYADVWRQLPAEVMSQDWVKSRDREKIMFDEELYVRLHDRWRDQSAYFDVVGPSEMSTALPLLEPIERFPNEPPRRVVPIKRLMLQWVAWALEAPEIKPGRKT